MNWFFPFRFPWLRVVKEENMKVGRIRTEVSRFGSPCPTTRATTSFVCLTPTARSWWPGDGAVSRTMISTPMSMPMPMPTPTLTPSVKTEIPWRNFSMPNQARISGFTLIWTLGKTLINMSPHQCCWTGPSPRLTQTPTRQWGAISSRWQHWLRIKSSINFDQAKKFSNWPKQSELLSGTSIATRWWWLPIWASGCRLNGFESQS